MKPDSAVLKLLQLDPGKSRVSSPGGRGCSSANISKITTRLEDGMEKCFFMKTGRGKDAQVMFEGEHASLNALHSSVPSICPKSYGWGRFADSHETYFLVTDFLHLSPRYSRSSSSSSTLSLAQKLAKLHTTPVPVPEGYDAPQFGFPVTTCCGDTPQDNTFKSDWADFYANNRLRFVLRLCELKNGPDHELSRLVETTASVVVPRLLSASHLNNGKGITPATVHGDLWSGNASRGTTDLKGEPEEMVYDPSACYAHSEYELGIMKMFGGFEGSFLQEYHSICPKTEPVEEYEDRVALYELYHHLNHYALFGSGYRHGALSIMRNLVRKFGNN